MKVLKEIVSFGKLVLLLLCDYYSEAEYDNMNS